MIWDGELVGAILLGAAGAATGIGVLTTGLLLGIRHGIDWDHIAAITDITSTSTIADDAEDRHRSEHGSMRGHTHAHGGSDESVAHGHGASVVGPADVRAAPLQGRTATPGRAASFGRRPMVLGTLYALGHALVVIVLGIAALAFGATLPDWIDPIMGRIVGATLVLLGIYVFFSLYQYVRYGGEFRLRSRWLLVFDASRSGWRRLQARLHGHTHVDPVEATSYGPRTAFGVGMIHGVGAETASQVLIIAAVGGAASSGLGIPMLLAFVVGLVVSNSAIVLLTTGGFVASQTRQRIYVVVGIIAGTFSLWIGTLFVLGAEAALPDLGDFFGWIGRGP